MSPDTEQSPIECNRSAWDLLTSVHVDSDFYDLASFRSGANTLCPLEQDIVGNVGGKHLLHLQCHFGLDTLSWARLGAHVTGIDFSSAAIKVATDLAEVIDIDATFLTADVQDLPTPQRPYDLVVSTYGVLCWLERLSDWADGVRRCLRVGGRFVLVDFHPILEALHPGKMTGARGYFPTETRGTWTDGSYADRQAPVRYLEYRWQHPLSAVVSAVLDAGLELVQLREYPYCSYPLFDELDHYADGGWHRSDRKIGYPYMFALVARRVS